MPSPLDILITGGTGYIGRNLIPLLLARGHRVRVLAREESVKHVPASATAVIGDALNDDSVVAALRGRSKKGKGKRSGKGKRVTVS